MRNLSGTPKLTSHLVDTPDVDRERMSQVSPHFHERTRRSFRLRTRSCVSTSSSVLAVKTVSSDNRFYKSMSTKVVPPVLRLERPSRGLYAGETRFHFPNWVISSPLLSSTFRFQVRVALPRVKRRPSCFPKQDV